MIKIKERTFFIRDIKVPAKMELKIRAGIPDNNYCNKKSMILDLNPSDYILGGSKCTGKIIQDLFSYLSNVYDNVITNVYFDVTKKEEQDIARRTLHHFQTGSISDKWIAGLIKPSKEIILNKDAVDYMSTNQVLNVMIEKFDTDAEALDVMGSEALFMLMFVNHRINSNTLAYSSGINKMVLSQNYNRMNLDMEEFLNALTKVFFYFYSETAREHITARAVESYALIKNGMDVFVWDRYISKYVPFDLNNSPLYTASVRTVASNLNPYSIKDNERMTFGDSAKSIDTCEETFISTIVNRNQKHYSDRIHGLGGYAGYVNPKTGLGEAVGILLEFKHEYNDKSRIINSTLYGESPYSLVMDSISDLAFLDLIVYDDYEIFKSTDLLANSKMVAPEVTVVYVTRAGGKTTSTYSELKDKRIPKQRRDLIFKALCDICYEYDIEPMKVIDKLDVDFKRYYKGATQFE